jgi:hypothetical protein
MIVSGSLPTEATVKATNGILCRKRNDGPNMNGYASPPIGVQW